MNRAEIEGELLELRKRFDSVGAAVIREFLVREFDEVLDVFVLHNHLGQAEEYYIIMVNGAYIVELEVVDGGVVDSYKSGTAEFVKNNPKMPRHFKFRLDVARSLSGF